MLHDNDFKQLETVTDPGAINDDQIVAYSIAVSLKRIADDMAEIKNGMRFICERWTQKRF